MHYTNTKTGAVATEAALRAEFHELLNEQFKKIYVLGVFYEHSTVFRQIDPERYDSYYESWLKVSGWKVQK